MSISSQKLQFSICFTCYVFLGFAIFNPIFYSKNPIISFVACILTSTITVCTVAFLHFKGKVLSFNNSILSKSFSCLCSVLGILSVLLLMTQVIKDTCYIAGKGVSKEYYLLLSLALLGVSLYLCFNTEKGIYRFCFLSAVPILIFIISSVLPFFTVKGVVIDVQLSLSDSVAKAIKNGIIGGLFLSIDTSVFFYCFSNYMKEQVIKTRHAVTCLIYPLLLWSICIFCVYALFGKNTVLLLQDPLYALTKSYGGFDITESLSSLRIFAFIIKSSVYIYSCSMCIQKAFFSEKKHALKIIIPCLFSAVPLIYLPYIFISSDSYGKFQGLIYPSVILLSLFFIFANIFEKKEN